MKKRARQALSPDITPLIDVVFLLLIFFMVSTVFKKDELALLLNLPETAAGISSSNRKTLTIELDQDKLALDGKTVSLEQLNESLKKVENKKLAVDVRIDKQVPYERVVKVLDRLKANNLNNLSLVTNTIK